MMKTMRVCIYPKDVQRITGKSERYGRLLLQRIKTHFDKEPHQFVTVIEFSEYTGIHLELVERFITD